MRWRGYKLSGLSALLLLATFMPKTVVVPARTERASPSIVSLEKATTLVEAREAIARLPEAAALPLTRADAAARNASRPPDAVTIAPARRFSVTGAGAADALHCMTQAIYYEAASEPDAGQRAVAQVVLNRLRHPAFPHTVCGVVYQGWEGATGCQFSFTCDGSLARVPSAHGWRRAQGVAAASLSGRVEASVGTATHYHADYVVPYWASSLNKAVTLGAHIFYTIRGRWGRPAIFRAAYDAAAEARPRRRTEPQADVASATEAIIESSPLAKADAGDGYALPVAERPSATRLPDSDSARAEVAPRRLMADEAAGTLIERGGRPGEKVSDSP